MCATCSTPATSNFCAIPALYIIQHSWRGKKTLLMTRVQLGFVFIFVRSFVRIGCVSMRIKDNPILRLANKLLPNTRSKTSKHIKSPSKIIGRKKMKKKKCALTELNICSLPLEKVNKMCPRCSTPPLLEKK